MQLESEPIQSTEYRSELKKNSRDQRSLGNSDKTSFQANRRTDLPDRFKPERPNLSYADLHHEVTKNVKDISSKTSVNNQKPRIDRKGNEDDELVKYMSNLPSYLEKGKNPKEKALNVGVLDWGRLEKWQCSQKQVPYRSGRPSLSCSNFSSSFSSDASSSNSSRRYIASPPRPRMHRPSLQFHLTSSPVQGHHQDVQSLGQSVESCDLKDAQSNNSNVQGKFIRSEKPLCKNNQDMNSEECRRKYSDPKIDRESGTLTNGVKYEVASSKKVNMTTHDGQFMKRAGKLQEGNPDDVDLDVPGKHRTVVLLMPKDLPQNNLSGVSNVSDSTLLLGQKPAEARRRSFSERSKELDVISDFPHSSPLPSQYNSTKYLPMKQTGSMDAKIDNLSSERSCSVSCSAKIDMCPSKGGNDRKSSATIKKPITDGPSVGSDLKVTKAAPEKVRSTSPFRRLSFSVSKIGKNSSSKEASALPQSKSTCVSAQSGSQKAVISSGPETSNSDKTNATSRARSSPLRRLLDPILKAKPGSCHTVDEPLSKDRATKSSNERPYSSSVAAQTGRVKFDVTGCKTANVSDPYQEKHHGSPAVQALLRVAVKNGQPLFTLAVDNESDILAATMKKLSTSRKEDYSCIYTFFTIQEVKKKNGRWLNSGGKSQNHDYIPNVVAQMKVCGSNFSGLTRDNHLNQFSIREFVLFSVELRQADQQTPDFQPNDELGAIIVKIPLRISRSSLINGHQGGMKKDLPEVGLKEYSSEAIFDSNSGKDAQNGPLIGNQDISANVILPSGVHSLPRKGEPSSLIQRWKSGGSCDCGGWDLGCKLRVMSNQSQRIKKAGSSKGYSTINQFQLFSEGGDQHSQPLFSLAPYKDGVYSVEFNSSLSLLQAFSICISVLDSRKACESCESSDLLEQKTSAETVLVQNGGTRLSERIEAEVPARYVSYPPLSPVGRV